MSPLSQNSPVPFYLTQGKSQTCILPCEDIPDLRPILLWLNLQSQSLCSLCSTRWPSLRSSNMPHVLLPQGLLPLVPSDWNILHPDIPMTGSLTNFKSLLKFTFSMRHPRAHLLKIFVSHLSLCIPLPCFIFLSRHLIPSSMLSTELLDCFYYPVYEDPGCLFYSQFISHACNSTWHIVKSQKILVEWTIEPLRTNTEKFFKSYCDFRNHDLFISTKYADMNSYIYLKQQTSLLIWYSCWHDPSFLSCKTDCLTLNTDQRILSP